MASQIECPACENHYYSYTEEERNALIIACGVKYMQLIQQIELVKKVRLDDVQVLTIWEMMIDLGVEKIK